MSQPSPDPELMGEEERLWTELHRIADSLLEDKVREPGWFAECWSAKDLVAHIGSWLAEAGVVLERIRFGTYRPLDEELFMRGNIAPILALRGDGSFVRGRGPMDALFLIGRILFGLLFVVSGLAGHFLGYQQLKGYAAAKKFPLAGPAVLVSGVMILLGGIGLAAGIWPDLSALVIAVFLFFTSFFIHNFWTVKDDAMMRLTEMTQFQKDLALLGAALVFFAVTAYGGEFGPTLTDPLFAL